MNGIELTGTLFTESVDPDGSVCVACGCECYLDMHGVKVRIDSGPVAGEVVDMSEVLCGSCAEIVGRYEYEVSDE